MDLCVNIKEVLKFELSRKYKQLAMQNYSNLDCEHIAIAFKMIKSEFFKASDGL